MNEIEQRLHNLECAFLAYVGLTQDILPPEIAQLTDNMLGSYFEATENSKAFEIAEFITIIAKDNEDSRER